MLLSTVLAFARAQAQTDSNGLTDANGIIYANEALMDFHRRMVEKGVDAAQVQETYSDATANQGTYLFPTDMLFLKAIELNYNDTTQSNYFVATSVDVSNLPLGQSFGWLRTYADPSMPQFNSHGDWFEIFPTPTTGNNLSQLIRIFYFKQPTLYVATSDTVAYPENLDAAILGWRVAANFLYSLGTQRIADGDKFNAKYDERVKQYIGTLGRGSQQPINAVAIQNDGWDY
jgi:hypothetical protein